MTRTRPSRSPLQRLLAASVATALLAGCATVAPQSPPAAGVAVPAGWAGTLQAAPASAGDPWREFGDALLQSLVADALAANTDVLGAQAQLRRARAARDAAAAALLPTLNASASAGRSRTPPQTTQNSLRAGFDASWEPDLFGANAHADAAAAADAEASAASLAATRLAVAGEVALGYLQLRGTQARLALAQANLAAQEETLQIARWRSQAGLATALDVAQAQSAVEQTRAQLPTLQSSAAQSRHALAVLTGRPPAALDSQLTLSAALPAPPTGLSLDLPASTLRRRPDVMASERQLQAAAERVAQKQAEKRPQISLQGSLAWSALTLGSLGSSAAAASLLAALSQPLFDGGARDAALRQQEASFDAARASYAASVLAALQDVEDSLAQLAAARQRLDALRIAEQAARDAALLATQRYASGIVDFQIVLDTQRTLLNVQDSAATAQTDWVSGHVRVLKALGIAPAEENKS
jgi:outer membrane protein, multidrug efflux system